MSYVPNQQHYSLLPISIPHVNYTRLADPSNPPQPFPSSTSGSLGGRLELDHGISPSPLPSSTPDVFLHLVYYPRSAHESPVSQTIKAATEIYQESATSFLLRVPNEFHTEDVPAHEQDPGVFDCWRLQFYDDVATQLDQLVPEGEWRREYEEPHYYGSVGTWADIIDRVIRVFNQYTTFRDPFLGSEGYAGGYEGGSSPQMGYWPDEKKGGYGGHAKYDPGQYASEKSQGRLIFVDEDTGSPVLGMEGAKVEAHGIQHGVKDPVEIVMPTTPGAPVIVQPAPSTYLQDAMSPAYASSSIVNTAMVASRFIVTTSEYISKAMLNSADKFTKTTKPNSTPITFSPTAHNRIQQFHNFSTQAARFSAKSVERVQTLAQNLGAKVGGKDKEATNRDGTPKKPGILNKSLIAFGTVADGVETAAKHLLNSTTVSATTVIGHKYGDEARQVAHGIGHSVKNVGLVYVDASGVSRRAVVKSVAKGMVVGRVRGGSVTQPNNPQGQEEVIVYGGGENASYYGAQSPPAYGGASGAGSGGFTDPSNHVQPGVGLDSFGNATRQPSFPSNAAPGGYRSGRSSPKGSKGKEAGY